MSLFVPEMHLEVMPRARRLAFLLLPALGGVACASKSVLLMPRDGGAGMDGASGAPGTGGGAGAGGGVSGSGGSAASGSGGGGASGGRGGVTFGTWGGGGGPAVAFQVDVAHSGNQPASTLTPPLTRAWSMDFAAGTDFVSYPLIVGGTIFVTTSATGSTLRALDVSTGNIVWGPIDIGARGWSSAAYGDGRVYVVNSTGLVTAFDAASGATLWSKQMPGQYAFSSPPTASGGMVFVGGAGVGGTLYGVDGAAGTVMWTASVMNGDDSSPALSPDAVFVSYACVQAYAFSRTTGTLLWHHDGPCEGGGGATPVLWQGRLWATDWASSNLVLDATNGAEVGSFTAGSIPAFADQRGFLLSNNSLQALDVTTRTMLWSFDGDGALASAPLVVNGVVYVGSGNGELYAVDPTTGTMKWSETLPWGAPQPGDPALAPTMGAGGNALVVTAGNHLVCYR